MFCSGSCHWYGGGMSWRQQSVTGVEFANVTYNNHNVKSVALCLC